MPALSILIWLPAASGLLGALLPARSRRAPGIAALAGSLVALALAIGYIADYKPGTAGLQHVTDVVWISELGIHYKLGIDGLNVFLLGLTTLLFAAAVLASNLRMKAQPFERPKLFYFQFMLAESAVLGAFLAQDLALFVAFFDLMLIPFYFLIGGWGREPGRVKATIKLVIYTLVGSLLDARGRDSHRRAGRAAGRRAHHVRAVLASGVAAQHGIARVDLPVLRSRIPREDARVPAARLDARRLPRDADRGADGLLRGALEGGGVRLPADRAAAVSAGCRALPDADAADRAGVDHLRLGRGLHPDGRAADHRVLLRRADGLHNARHLRAEPAGRAGRPAADVQPRARGGGAAVHSRAARRASRRLGGHTQAGRHRVPRARARDRCF